ncbi:adenosylcobinamide-GDP ribazoletransferase [Chachezhania sediminis]|uniref:adenosylcobinamide-GDP ribazoletransferase n=1 Tax=Chachezhania sediminis TaxID=2599291 RepID=UPI00131EA3FF|nr:adenosylcobinamide-GDP ribazoletransferase [Chachezhania sediminis]
MPQLPFRQALQDARIALSLLTRLPLPPLPDEAFRRTSAAVWAYPLAGLCTALPAGLLATAALGLGLMPTVAAGLALGVMILLTGAMHEDGLADSADGLFGGWTRDRRLEIMKDSRIGAYGVIALILGLGLRWSLLSTLLFAGIGPLLAAAMLSRSALPWLMHVLPSARAQGLAQSVGRPGRGPALAGSAIALLLSGLLIGLPALAAGLATALTASVVARMAMKRIGGQTGDILGATQVLTEIACLLTFAALAA